MVIGIPFQEGFNCVKHYEDAMKEMMEKKKRARAKRVRTATTTTVSIVSSNDGMVGLVGIYSISQPFTLSLALGSAPCCKAHIDDQ
jgi:hypothetical protein